MGRIYKTIRFAYETKYWIDELIRLRTDQLQKSIRENNLQGRVEDQLFNMNEDDLDGISINISLNVTAGSIIEQAVRYSRTLSIDDWNALSVEVENAKEQIRSELKRYPPAGCLRKIAGWIPFIRFSYLIFLIQAVNFECAYSSSSIVPTLAQ